MYEIMKPRLMLARDLMTKSTDGASLSSYPRFSRRNKIICEAKCGRPELKTVLRSLSACISFRAITVYEGHSY